MKASERRVGMINMSREALEESRERVRSDRRLKVIPRLWGMYDSEANGMRTFLFIDPHTLEVHRVGVDYRVGVELGQDGLLQYLTEVDVAISELKGKLPATGKRWRAVDRRTGEYRDVAMERDANYFGALMRLYEEHQEWWSSIPPDQRTFELCTN